MSYDLMVFEAEAASRDHERFLAWYRQQVTWSEGHGYGDPSVTSSRLRDWFAAITVKFPSLNGVFSVEDLPVDEATATEYSIGKEIIYAGFAWSKVEPAYRAVFELAAKHGLGFFNVSSDEQEVWLPVAGELILAHKKEPPTLLARLRGLFKR